MQQEPYQTTSVTYSIPPEDFSSFARLLGRRGGSVKSERKAEAARRNGALGGRPKKEPKPANE